MRFIGNPTEIPPARHGPRPRNPIPQPEPAPPKPKPKVRSREWYEERKRLAGRELERLNRQIREREIREQDEERRRERQHG